MNKLSIFLFLTLLIFSQCSEESAYQPKPIMLDDEVTIDQIHSAFENAEYNVRDLVHFYLERIKAIDQAGPNLNSVLTINPNAMEIAANLDAEYENRKDLPLFGIPVLLKDNIDTKDSMPNTAGSRVMMQSFPERDAPLVAQLRDAGAVILGKTNLSEWANFHSDMSSSGWSGLGGQTNNPYQLDHNPCGSSAGSGVAVSANLCVLAIGTETNGSIMCPSTLNGIVGIKPTVGLISRTGIIPISHTHDTSGPMARTVKDAAIALGTMTALDSDDSAMSKEGRMVEDYISNLDLEGLAGKRIGYYSKPLAKDDSQITTIMENALEVLRDNGAMIIEVPEILDPKTETHSFLVMQYEFKDGVNKYLASLGPNAPVKTLDEVIEKTFADSIEMKFDHKLLKKSNARGDLNDPVYVNALDSMLLSSRMEGIDKVMQENELDAIVAISGGPAWKTDHVNGDKYEIYSSSPAAISGYPSVTVPMGFVGELPIGMSIFGLPWTEAELIEIAYAYEQKTKHRSTPKYIK